MTPIGQLQPYIWYDKIHSAIILTITCPMGTVNTISVGLKFNSHCRVDLSRWLYLSFRNCSLNFKLYRMVLHESFGNCRLGNVDKEPCKSDSVLYKWYFDKKDTYSDGSQKYLKPKYVRRVIFSNVCCTHRFFALCDSFDVAPGQRCHRRSWIKGAAVVSQSGVWVAQPSHLICTCPFLSRSTLDVAKNRNPFINKSLLTGGFCG